MQRVHWKHAPPASESEYLPNDLVTSRIDLAKRERALLEARVRDMVVAAMETPDPIVVVSPRASPRTQLPAPVLPTRPSPPAPAPVFTAPQAPTLPRKADPVRRGKYDANLTFVIGGAADTGDLLSELADFDSLLKSSARRSTQQSKQPSPKGSPRHKHGTREAAPAAAAIEAVAPSAQDEKALSNPKITSVNVNKRVRWKADRKVAHQRWRTLGWRLAVLRAAGEKGISWESLLVQEDAAELASVLGQRTGRKAPSLVPRRIGELSVATKIADVNDLIAQGGAREAIRSRWTLAKQKLKVTRAFNRPETPLVIKAKRTWKDSEEPEPVMASSSTFDASHHRGARRAHLALKLAANMGDSQDASAFFSTCVQELSRMRYSIAAPVEAAASVYRDEPQTSGDIWSKDQAARRESKGLMFRDEDEDDDDEERSKHVHFTGIEFRGNRKSDLKRTLPNVHWLPPRHVAMQRTHRLVPDSHFALAAVNGLDWPKADGGAWRQYVRERRTLDKNAASIAAAEAAAAEEAADLQKSLDKVASGLEKKATGTGSFAMRVDAGQPRMSEVSLKWGDGSGFGRFVLDEHLLTRAFGTEGEGDEGSDSGDDANEDDDFVYRSETAGEGEGGTGGRERDGDGDGDVDGRSHGGSSRDGHSRGSGTHGGSSRDGRSRRGDDGKATGAPKHLGTLAEDDAITWGDPAVAEGMAKHAGLPMPPDFWGAAKGTSTATGGGTRFRGGGCEVKHYPPPPPEPNYGIESGFAQLKDPSFDPDDDLDWMHNSPTCWTPRKQGPLACDAEDLFDNHLAVTKAWKLDWAGTTCGAAEAAHRKHGVAMEKQRIFGRKGLTPECCYELQKICERWYVPVAL